MMHGQENIKLLQQVEKNYTWPSTSIHAEYFIRVMKEGILLWIVKMPVGIFIFAGRKYVLNGKISKPEIRLGLL